MCGGDAAAGSRTRDDSYLEWIRENHMCHQITCPRCGKPTWQGCGEHIDQALWGVAVADRCHCQPATQQEHDIRVAR
ncbi:Uncharacterised protein [Acidipropionibacterium jensenii]|uniref:Uncharacterized protein n=2 Tax=Acidipropionibacterium jensenii TaxID=1749 RepID=A0A448P0Y0_9ACTN|nr:Uncharacterised protein [Acidipropionibacterium jensenii]